MAMMDYWREHPPVHLLVAGFMGYKPKAPEPVTIGPTGPAPSTAMEDISVLMSMFPNDGPQHPVIRGPDG